MRTLLALPGDGIGPTVTEAALDVLDALAPDVDVIEAPVGRQPLADTGHPLPVGTREHLDEADAVLFGATETRPGEPSAVLALREATDARLSLRPAGGLLDSDEPVVTVYRELTEGLYAGPGDREEGHAWTARELTRPAVRAFAELALDRVPTEATPTLAHKATVLPHTDGLFRETIREVAQADGREVDDAIVDALAHEIAREPQTCRHVLAPNLYGDLLSDVAAGLHGGLGLTPSLTLGEGPPIAEPVHGTAPDIAGTDQANPTAMLASLALLLDELDRVGEARTLQDALRAALATPEARTPDLGGPATTQTLTRHVRTHVQEAIA